LFPSKLCNVLKGITAKTLDGETTTQQETHET